MLVSQKSRYALRALFELAKGQPGEPMTIADIAEAQAIPPRFLEAILAQLKQGGFVVSKRGSGGGYFLNRPPQHISVGDILRFMEGPFQLAGCIGNPPKENCPLGPDCVFLGVWKEASHAIEGVYDATSLRDLVEREKAATRASKALDFAI